MKRNILYIFNDITLGGAALSLLDTLTEIKRDIHPIVAMQETIREEAYKKFEELGIRCYRIPFSTDHVPVGDVTDEKKDDVFRQSYEAALLLLPIIRQENVHLIHINSSVSYFAALAALMAGIPYIWHIRELLEEQFGCEFLDIRTKLDLYARADGLIAISDYVRKKYQERFSVDTTKIYNGLDLKRFRTDIDSDREAENIFLAASAVISAEKGQLDAIKAVEILLSRGCSDVQLIIIGDGDDLYIWAIRKYIKQKKLEDHIHILPFQYDLSDLRRKAPYAITCSQNEALGRVTIEAMLAGEFVIGARSGGTTEIIGEHEERGFLYALHDSEDLADAMARAMKTPAKEKAAIIKSAQEYAERIFDPKRYHNEILQLYDQAICSFRPKDQETFLGDIRARYESVKNSMVSTDQVSTDQISTDRLAKLQAAFDISIKWLEIKQHGHGLAEYFMDRGIKSIAIYGMASLGRRLYDELEDSDITIKYLIDREPYIIDKVLEFVPLGAKVSEVDAIVVTVASVEQQVVDEIKSLGYENVIGLSDILNAIDA